MIRRDEEKREPLQFRFGSDIAKFPRVTMVASMFYFFADRINLNMLCLMPLCHWPTIS